MSAIHQDHFMNEGQILSQVNNKKDLFNRVFLLPSVFKKWWSINQSWCAETSGTGPKPKVRLSLPSFSFYFLTKSCQTSSKFHLSFYSMGKHCCIPESADWNSKIKAGNVLFEIKDGFADVGHVTGKCIQMVWWDICWRKALGIWKEDLVMRYSFKNNFRVFRKFNYWSV